MNTHEIGTIEITLLTTIGGDEQNRGTQNDKGTTINAKISNGLGSVSLRWNQTELNQTIYIKQKPNQTLSELSSH